MVQPVNIHDAKTNLSKLIQRVEAGEEIVIARAGKPVAKLVPADPNPVHNRIGFMIGKITVPLDFDTLGAEEIAELFDQRK